MLYHNFKELIEKHIMLKDLTITNNEFLKSIDLIDDSEIYSLNIDKISYSVEKTILSRLNKWIHYFNQNYTKFICGYSHTVMALIDTARNNQIFRTQTEHEFRISLKFYDFIFNSDIFFILNTTDVAKQLLNISLMYGKYSGMVIRSTRSSIKLLENGVHENSLNELFKTLFVKYENPFILTYNFSKLNLLEIDSLMHILQGNNIRNFDKLPFPISKKESYQFIYKLPLLKFEKNTLEKALICSKLSLCKSYSKKLLLEFVSCSRVLEFKPYVFHDDIGFWRRAFELICVVHWDYSPIRIQEYVDYFEYKKYTEDTNYSLKGRTSKSVTRAIINWHEASDYVEKIKLLKLKWNGSNLKETRLEQEGINYLIKEITNGKELFSESEKMKHCVFSYIECCARGYTSIWSLKKKVNSTYSPHITIEVRNNNVIQIAGKRNRQINHMELEVIEKWVKELNFTIDQHLLLE